MLNRIIGLLIFIGSTVTGYAQVKKSPFAKIQQTELNDVRITGDFWKERQAICTSVMLPELWSTYTSDTICFAFKNFKVAAGIDSGRFRGPSFHDGDFYKTLEAASAVYSITHDPLLLANMDAAIDVIRKAQRDDGYIYTKNLIEERKSGKRLSFDDALSFEAYNFGHLMTAACMHFRATGKRSLLDIAIKAASFLEGFYARATPEQARNAICPSHYMGLAELYKTTNDLRYVKLLDHLFKIRGTVEGTDDNSDRAPFNEMKKVVGHAVRANYLLAGAADLYAETGNEHLKSTLNTLWDNVTHTKLYITGGCGALYDGISVDGTAYKPDTVQKIHQAYGRDFQLPNLTAHNETCANIGNVLWNWRMFLISGQAKYLDILELSLYNSVLSGGSLDGHSYFYTNPLAASSSFPYHLRWEGGRVPYISKSNCYPPNLVRTIAEVQLYQYALADHAVYVNLYGSNTFENKTKGISIEQITAYPWTGNIKLKINQLPVDFLLHLRLPEWCTHYTVQLNGKRVKPFLQNGFLVVKAAWKKGDNIQLNLDMPVHLMESNPLVEETRGLVSVKKGPIVYCIEEADKNVFELSIPVNGIFQSNMQHIKGQNIQTLTTNMIQTGDTSWTGQLYRPISKQKKTSSVTLIPYFAWANRGHSEMTVWMPVIK